MTVTFAQKLERMPHYEAGLHEDAARATFGSEAVIKLASNESPWGPHPAVAEAIGKASAGLNRYPDQHATRLRGRIAERFEIEPARVAVGNGSCEILLAAAEALCEPGDELLFAWPSFSIYPHLAALSGAREIRVPARRRLRPRPRCDARRGHRRDPAVLSSATPTTRPGPTCPPRRSPPSASGFPTTSRCPRRGLRRVPDRRRPGRHPGPAGRVPQSDVCGRSASSTAWRASVSATRSARPASGGIDAVSQPFGVNEIAQAAAAEAINHSDDVIRRVEQTIVERVRVEQGLAELDLARRGPRPTSPGSPSGEPRRGGRRQRPSERGIHVRGGTPLGGPGHMRVTYGTRKENERFLAALETALDSSGRNC